MAEKVLVVDDEPTIVEFVKINLEKAGFEVLTAGDGEAALKWRLHRSRMLLCSISCCRVKTGLRFAAS
jgi:DNA-binding response OmpR family regulator